MENTAKGMVGRVIADRETRRCFGIKAAFGGSLLVLAGVTLLPFVFGANAVPQPGAVGKASGGGLSRSSGFAGGPARALDQAETQADAFNFPPDAPVRNRKNFHDLMPDELDDLVSAYRKLKDLQKQGDNRYWTLQAQIHANHCGGQYLEVHSSWWFLPWHHSYLYFYERILASLSRDPAKFALPYWDWSKQRGIPNTTFNEAHGKPNPLFDPAGPLFDGDRFPKASFTFDDNPNPNGFSPQVAFYTSSDYLNKQLLMDSSFDYFGGSVSSAGDLESSPHNQVHMWVGTVGSDYRDMGNLTYAAKDLIFFLHHANVDRLWSSWLAEGHTNPDKKTNPSWYSRWFNFYDEKGAQVSVTVEDVASGKMRISYAQTHTLLEFAPPTHEIQLGGRLSLPTVKVAKSTANRLAQLGAPTGAGNREAVRLLLEGVEAPREVPVTILIFVNKPDAKVPDDFKSPNFIGSYTSVPSTGAAHGPASHKPINISVDVTNKLPGLVVEGDNLAITLVTVQPRGAPEGTPMKVSFKTASLIVTGR